MASALLPSMHSATSGRVSSCLFRRRRARFKVQDKEKGRWLFGGFTALGFRPPSRYYADPAAFLFSLTNSLGHPEKLESLHTGHDLYYEPRTSASFSDGTGFAICNDADTVPCSSTKTNDAYAESAAMGAHPMGRGFRTGWFAAEVVAWVV